MARVKLDNLNHSYVPNPTPEDYVLKNINIEWNDGGAYALLGPSGCGKTTILNIISGLINPTSGSILFDDKDVTNLSPLDRNIGQVFQFPVIYDTMTVYDNLAFPLKNRGFDSSYIDKKVREIAEILELSSTLQNRASGLTADGKQKISLGRGLVRSDVNVLMFDEPLTVIDPLLKWQLRSKLKELHHEFKNTMIYVTHDQTEALTFADQVVVMYEGVIVQIGTPTELFETPKHTFVGHFIGSPGMNILPCDVSDQNVTCFNHQIKTSSDLKNIQSDSKLEIGVRPEFIKFSSTGLPAEVKNVSDIGRYKVVECLVSDQKIKVIVNEGEEVPADKANLEFSSEYTKVYQDSWMVS